MTEFWTEERLDRLRALAAEGLSASQIAAEIGTTRNAVCGKLHRLGIKRSAYVVVRSPEDIARSRERARARMERRNERRRELRAARRADLMAACLVPEPATMVAWDMQAGRVPLLDARPNQCRFPAADDGSAHLVCGARVVSGESWCPQHYGIVFEPARRRVAA